MFIYIDESICSPFNEELNITLENLAHAHRDGKHFIFGKKSTLKYIIEHADIHERYKSIYKILYSQYPQLAGILSLLSTYILATSSTQVATRITRGEQTILRIPLKTFRDSSSLEPVSIIGEDTSDIDFYTYLAKAYAVKQKIPSKFTHFPVHGGGNLTGNTYNTYQNLNKMTLCIVDCDVKAEPCGKGDTARLVEDNDKEDKLLGFFYIINVHEAENMIPLKILDEVSETAEEYDSLTKIQNNKTHDLMKYIDYKQQLRLLSILNHEKPCYREYWQANMSILAPDKNLEECIQNHEECIIFNGFGANILTRSIDVMKQKSFQNLAKDCNSIVHISEWENISKLIIAWSFSPSPISA